MSLYPLQLIRLSGLLVKSGLVAVLPSHQLCTWMDDLTIYMDGVGYMGHAGAALATWHQVKAHFIHLQHRLGRLGLHTIFEAELVGPLLGIHIIQDKVQQATPWLKTTLIALDNQAVLTALTNNTCQPNHTY